MKAIVVTDAILKLKPRLRTCAATYSQRPRPTVTPERIR